MGVISERTAVLTGGGGFIGAAFARALLEHGARVVIVERSPADMQFFSEQYEDRYETVFVDLYDREAAASAYRAILAKYPIDILVNNAFDFSVKTGFNTEAGRLGCATFAQFQASFESGIYWAIQATQIIGSTMKAQGSIINVGSMYGVVVPDPALYEGTDRFNPPGYSMAKAGLLQWTKYAAAWLAPVRVNAISPGAIPNGSGVNAADARVSERLLQKIPLGRMGKPEDLTGALIYLASSQSAYMTGQNLIIDGGLTCL